MPGELLRDAKIGGRPIVAVTGSEWAITIFYWRLMPIRVDIIRRLLKSDDLSVSQDRQFCTLVFWALSTFMLDMS